MADECRSCHAEIIWAHTAAGRRMPVDAKPLDREPPNDGGVFVLLRTNGEAPLALPLVGLTALSLESATRAKVPLFVSHFSTCPNADEWRKP